jgi:hypothetical protein
MAAERVLPDGAGSSLVLPWRDNRRNRCTRPLGFLHIHEILHSASTHKRKGIAHRVASTPRLRARIKTENTINIAIFELIQG